MPRLTAIDAQCAASLALAPPQPNLVEENRRSYVLLLSAHFQGFCRNLYAECAQVIVSRIRPTLRALMQAQFTAHRRLDHGNPNVENLKGDFERFGFTLDLAAADPANAVRLTHLAELKRWRNVAAHHGIAPAGPPLGLPLLQAWRHSCDGLATSLDAIRYYQLRKILRRRPWVPSPRNEPWPRRRLESFSRWGTW
jgi:hypothetical protein